MVVIFAWTAIHTFLFYFILKYFWIARIDEEEEIDGHDVNCFGVSMRYDTVTAIKLLENLKRQHMNLAIKARHEKKESRLNLINEKENDKMAEIENKIEEAQGKSKKEIELVEKNWEKED